MFMSKRQIVAAFNKGLLEDVAKQLKKYGTISKDKSFEVLNGRYAGFHRVTGINHHDINWTVSMYNGDTISVEMTH